MSAEQDRDRWLESALKHELGAAASAPSGNTCLDAETIAAWMDGGLDQTAIAMAEAHAANCARCQALLGTLARTMPAVVVAEPRTARLWRWWFAPLAATAAAVTVWIVVPQDQFTAPPAPTAVAELAAPKAELAKPDAEVAVTQSAPAAAQPQAKDRALEARERPAETAKLADATAEGRVAAAAPPAVTARSSPSPDVIWFVGRGGMIMLATDGRTFLRVPFPETVDLTAVTATDERHAVVTTADGRVFETADGGRSWRQRP